MNRNVKNKLQLAKDEWSWDKKVLTISTCFFMSVKPFQHFSLNWCMFPCLVLAVGFSLFLFYPLWNGATCTLKTATFHKDFHHATGQTCSRLSGKILEDYKQCMEQHCCLMQKSHRSDWNWPTEQLCCNARTVLKKVPLRLKSLSLTFTARCHKRKVMTNLPVEMSSIMVGFEWNSQSSFSFRSKSD